MMGLEQGAAVKILWPSSEVSTVQRSLGAAAAGSQPTNMTVHVTREQSPFHT